MCQIFVLWEEIRYYMQEAALARLVGKVCGRLQLEGGCCKYFFALSSSIINLFLIVILELGRR